MNFLRIFNISSSKPVATAKVLQEVTGSDANGLRKWEPVEIDNKQYVGMWSHSGDICFPAFFNALYEHAQNNGLTPVNTVNEYGACRYEFLDNNQTTQLTLWLTSPVGGIERISVSPRSEFFRQHAEELKEGYQRHLETIMQKIALKKGQPVFDGPD